MPSNNGLNDYAMFIRIALTEEFMGGGGGGRVSEGLFCKLQNRLTCDQRNVMMY